ncbi:hypothetical protein AWJ20_3247 [Sugiyamaella lignohabitans]|uniref:Mitochondrial group I intron splicing factor CCM1 n=1 Tax=Sugiyamaella lignohabitans TaxID=796027 RepID=A0A161HHQ5_9ASCO|nr:uncharacterized protein AWJ20_3247 [Sugiyamaella lignohabitans]ANB15610.1 hypothetical protein AWJ20_3247 [Sugiyamaella lignohabitans]
MLDIFKRRSLAIGSRACFSTSNTGRMARKGIVPLKSRLREVLGDENDGISMRISGDKKNKLDNEISKPDIFKVNDLLSSRVETFFSQDIYKLLKSTPTFNVRHGLVFRFLGTSVERVKNSYLVAEDVEKQLIKGNLAQAIYIVKLARTNGSVGMNLILKHILSHDITETVKGLPFKVQGNKSEYNQQLAQKVYHLLRKWGVPVNSHTHSILFNKNSLIKSTDKKSVDMLIDKYRRSISQLPLKSATVIVNGNATLAALGNLASIDRIKEFFDEMPHKDKITYTTMFNILGRRGPSEGNQYREKVWSEFLNQTKHRQGVQLDGLLARAYLFATMREQNGAQLVLDEFETLFDLNKLVGWNLKPENGLQESSSTFEINKQELSILLECLYQTANHDMVTRLFEALNKKNSPILDMSHFNIYIKTIEVRGAVNLVGPLLELFSSRPELKPSAEMYAGLIRAYINNEQPVTSKELETVKEIINLSKGGGKHSRLLMPVALAYCDLFNCIYSDHRNRPSGAFDRNHGIKALKVALSCTSSITASLGLSSRSTPSWFATHANFQQQTEALQSMIELCRHLEKRRWSNEISTGIYKLRKALMGLRASLEDPKLTLASIQSAVHAFNGHIDMVRKIMK